MYTKIFREKYDQIKEFIFIKGRLIDRVLFLYFFEDGNKKQCFKVLKAYQNEDGDFGNGIEPDLLCPHSNAISAETALYYLDLLDQYPSEILKPLDGWISKKLNQKGFISHPSEEIYEYPHQKWWENPDNERILAITGYLKKFGIENKELYKKVKSFFESLAPIEELTFYDYPKFLFLKFHKISGKDEKIYQKIRELFPVFHSKNKNHYPIWSRYWFHITSELEEELLDNTAKQFLSDIDKEGGIPNPYENLPWWKPIFTLDGLILLKKNEYI
jgi:hypothetical protein